MDKRIVEFIRTLRAAGVRISVAESADAMDAIDEIGLFERDAFRSALKTTLVKEKNDGPTFEHFFPFFFDSGAPPMFDMEQELTPEQQQMLHQALQSLMADMGALQQLLEQMIPVQAFNPHHLHHPRCLSRLSNTPHPFQHLHH